MVFISSRIKELKEERNKVEEGISELWNDEDIQFKFFRWEKAKEIPSGKNPDKIQSERVRNSNIYVLILGSEYGNFEYGESPTHEEYKIACSEIDEDCILIYIKEVEDREEKLDRWISEIKEGHTYKPFNNSHDLKEGVKTRLRDLWNKGKWKANMPTIQSTLRKEETTKGDFFKKELEWIDFEEGFIVERKEVDEIIKKLEKDNIQLVLGEPASGKSVIVKNIGFKLAKENKDVYVVELKKHSRDEVKRYFDVIPKIKDEKAAFIVDDAHIYLEDCEKLVREFKNMKLKAKLIIGSRETRELRGEHPKEASVFEHFRKAKKTCTHIHAEAVTEEIIKGFLKKEHHFSDERIETVSKNLEKYKKDLWFLSWALKAYNSDKDSVEEEEIYEKIKESIRNISAGKDNPPINAEDVFLPLSVFYRFEIPVERGFLKENMAIEENITNELIDLSEIIETEGIGKRRTFSLNHSSIAELYFKTYQNYPDLGRNTKKLFQEDRIEYCFFVRYINSAPTNSLDVLIHLGRDWLNKKGGRKLLKKLISDKEVKDSIIKSIEKEKDVEKIGLYVWTISKALSKAAGLRLANRIDTKNLLTKIEKEEDVQKIGYCVKYVTGASEQVGLKLANRINIDNLIAKLEKEEDIEKIGRIMRHIAEVSEEVALKFVDAFSSRIEKEADIEKIGLCVSIVAQVSEEVALKFVDVVSLKIEVEKDIGKIEGCMGFIADVSEEVIVELANRINIKVLSSKIEQEGVKEKIDGCVWVIARASKEVARVIINRLNPKLREELLERRWLK